MTDTLPLPEADTRHVAVTIGWTKDTDFMSYTPGAEQHEITFDLDIPETTTDETLAEWCFVAMNSPVPAPEGTVTRDILTSVLATGFNGSQSGHYSLSVGDTVTIDGTQYACTMNGWSVVPRD